jgi:CspA family cold shock protein
MIGKIKLLKTDGGYGFIIPESGGRDVFFHVSSLTEGVDYNDLKAGDLVSFDLGESPKGPQAMNVNLAQ